jgi:5-methylcytosine-specific restriction endonuclease McrA
MKLTKEDQADSKRVKERDGYKCQRCGSTPDPRGLHTHHLFTRSIKPLRHEDDNLITLCYGCHRWAHQYPLLAHEFFLGYLGAERYGELADVAHGKRDR